MAIIKTCIEVLSLGVVGWLLWIGIERLTKRAMKLKLDELSQCELIRCAEHRPTTTDELVRSLDSILGGHRRPTDPYVAHKVRAAIRYYLRNATDRALTDDEVEDVLTQFTCVSNRP